MSTYNGWTNRATWLVNLWFGENLTMMQEDGEEVSADYIESMITEYVDEIVPTSSFIADLIDLQEINWEELAEHYRE